MSPRMFREKGQEMLRGDGLSSLWREVPPGIGKITQESPVLCILRSMNLDNHFRRVAFQGSKPSLDHKSLGPFDIHFYDVRNGVGSFEDEVIERPGGYDRLGTAIYFLVLDGCLQEVGRRSPRAIIFPSPFVFARATG